MASIMHTAPRLWRCARRRGSSAAALALASASSTSTASCAPPHVAPGAEEDSLGSFLYLIPKVPKKNFRRMMENDRKILRFMARLDTDMPEDQGRIFVIKYYLSDDTVAVFEPPQKNSGIVGGNFLKRGTTQVKESVS